MASPTDATVQKYHGLSVILHWTMALAIVGMLGVGFLMEQDFIDRATQFDLIQWHKGLGSILLIAAFVRLLVKKLTKAPPIPSDFSERDKKLVKIGHAVFYVFIIGMPLSGWVMASASPTGLPIMVFGWYEFPLLSTVEGNQMVKDIADSIHGTLGKLFIALIVVHIAAVIKHKIKDKVNLLPRMWF